MAAARNVAAGEEPPALDPKDFRLRPFSAELPRQFDAVIHIDTTDAVQPLEPTSHWDGGEAPETYPIGL